jgi:hypothetical protein
MIRAGFQRFFFFFTLGEDSTLGTYPMPCGITTLPRTI